LSEHPDIAEVVIVGVPDARTGERACAVIVTPRSHVLDVPALREFLEKKHVARFKMPEQVEFWAALPRNSSGKILHHEIRARLLATTQPRGTA
jgi:cyclohexanecarboxylate-CoA ligase